MENSRGSWRRSGLEVPGISGRTRERSNSLDDLSIFEIGQVGTLEMAAAIA